MNSDGMKGIIGEDYAWPMPCHSDEAINRAILKRSQTGFRKCISSVALPQVDYSEHPNSMRHLSKVHGAKNLLVIVVFGDT